MSEEKHNVHPTSSKGYGEGKSEFYNQFVVLCLISKDSILTICALMCINRARPSYHPTVISFIRKAIRKEAPLNIVE